MDNKPFQARPPKDEVAEVISKLRVQVEKEVSAGRKKCDIASDIGIQCSRLGDTLNWGVCTWGLLRAYKTYLNEKENNGTQ